MKPADLEPYLTVKEVAEILRLEPKTIYNKIQEGIFPPSVWFHRPGLGVRFRRRALMEWVDPALTKPGAADYRKADGVSGEAESARIFSISDALDRTRRPRKKEVAGHQLARHRRKQKKA